MSTKTKTDAKTDAKAIADAKDGDAVPVTGDPANTTSLVGLLADAGREQDIRITRLEAEVLAIRQALIDLAALLRNAGPPTKGALECVTNTLDRLEPLL